MRTLTVLSMVILGSGLTWTAARSQEAASDLSAARQRLTRLRDPKVVRAQANARPVTTQPSVPSPTGAAAPVTPPVPDPNAAPLSAPVVPPTATPPATTVANPSVASSSAALFGEGPTTSGGLFDTSRFSGGANPQMIGDQSPFAIKQFVRPAAVTVVRPSQVPGLPQPFPPGFPPPPPSPRLATALVPSVRGFKIAENQSPQPQDRAFFTFNYFTDLNGPVNRRFEAPVNNIRAFRYIGGLEKTFDNGQGSFGFRLPMNTITASPAISGNFAKLGGTSTSLGDLSFFTKYVIKSDPKTGSLLSVGLELSVPTGPSQFGGARFLQGLHSTEIQPFIGYLLIRDRFYLHGFSSISTPSTIRDVTMIYNDLGVGYALFRSEDPDAFLTAFTPTFEIHVNNPLTHRDVFNSRDVAGTADVVDLTYGANMSIGRNSVASFGFVTPVTGPRPFNTEFIALFNYRFGRTRRNAPLPILGG